MYHHLETTKKPFIGKTLNAITRVAENIALVEFGDETKLQINVNGDCCSHSIFYELEMPDALIGATLEDIIEDSYNEKSEAVTTADDEETALAADRALYAAVMERMDEPAPPGAPHRPVDGCEGDEIPGLSRENHKILTGLLEFNGIKPDLFMDVMREKGFIPQNKMTFDQMPEAMAQKFAEDFETVRDAMGVPAQ